MKRFRYWLRENNLKSILQNFVLFFEKDKEYFGAGEDSRVTFARLKNPDSEVSKGWEDEANFSAINLNKMLDGQSCQTVFDKDDLKKIKIVDTEEIEKHLKDKPKLNISLIKLGKSDGTPDNFMHTDEE